MYVETHFSSTSVLQCDVVTGYKESKDELQKLLDDVLELPTLKIDNFVSLSPPGIN